MANQIFADWVAKRKQREKVLRTFPETELEQMLLSIACSREKAPHDNESDVHSNILMILDDLERLIDGILAEKRAVRPILEMWKAGLSMLPSKEINPDEHDHSGQEMMLQILMERNKENEPS